MTTKNPDQALFVGRHFSVSLIFSGLPNVVLCFMNVMTVADIVADIVADCC